MGNSSELRKGLSTLPIKSVTGSRFIAGAAELIPILHIPPESSHAEALGKIQLILKVKTEVRKIFQQELVFLLSLPVVHTP